KNSRSPVQAVSQRLAGRELDPSLVLEQVNEREPVFRLTTAELKSLRRGLRSLARLRVDARSLADLPAERFPQIGLPADQKGSQVQLNDIRRVTRLLTLDAELLAQEGQIDEALRSIRAGLKVSRSMREDPAMESQLM